MVMIKQVQQGSNEDDVDYSLELAPSPISLEIPVSCAGLRLDQALAMMLPEHSRSRLATWIKTGGILLQGLNADPKNKVWGGEQVIVQPELSLQEAAMMPEDIPLSIVYEDETILVIDKPAGLVVHPGSGNWTGTMLNGLLNYVPALQSVPRAGIVHRLDKETSGLLVVAKTLEAQTSLVRQLQARTVKRLYLALTCGVVSGDGLVDAPIGRHPTHRTRMAVVRDGREARTHYRIQECFARATLLQCQLETGRTHQIRVHLASIGHPLIGDPEYGRRKTGDAVLDAFPRQALHAWRLSLVHPKSNVDVAWEAPMPEDFSTLLSTLRER